MSFSGSLKSKRSVTRTRATLLKSDPKRTELLQRRRRRRERFGRRQRARVHPDWVVDHRRGRKRPSAGASERYGLSADIESTRRRCTVAVRRSGRTGGGRREREVVSRLLDHQGTREVRGDEGVDRAGRRRAKSHEARREV